MKIYIDSRICEELGISYDSPETESVIDKNLFIGIWERFSEHKETITTDIKHKKSFSKSKFSEFIALQTGDKMNLVNKGSGYFEIK